MHSEEFIRLVSTSGTNDLRIRFKSGCDVDAFISLYRWTIGNEDKFSIQIPGELTQMAIIQSRDWGHKQNLLVTVRGLSNLDHNALCNIAYDVEQVELPYTHEAQAITTKRQKSREEAVRKIIADVLSTELVSEVKDWNFTIVGELIEHLEMPAIQFMVCQLDGEMIFRVILDGWTGRFGTDGKVENGPEEPYVHPKQIQDFIRANLEKCLEEMTN